mmetsp:Transcript_8596/g.15418  ORF Transcript_8596/g.15418 Transcript_8596/m.15418 type:complete len:184 (+) Transcript_8596:99-650(+)
MSNSLSFTGSRVLLNSNGFKSMNSSDKSAAVRYLSLDGEVSQQIADKRARSVVTNPRSRSKANLYRFGSTAITFANSGVRPGLGIEDSYVRDPLTGVWFKNDPVRQRNLYLDSGSPMSLQWKDVHSRVHDQRSSGPHGLTLFPISSPRGATGNFWMQAATRTPKQPPLSRTAAARSCSQPTLS